jgi:DNA repair protein REV1
VRVLESIVHIHTSSHHLSIPRHVAMSAKEEPGEKGVNEDKREDGQATSPPASSFPIGSPSFWDEAANTIEGIGKREAEGNDTDQKPVDTKKSMKRARFASPSPEISSSPLRELVKAEDDLFKLESKAQEDGTARLSFLPNRLDPHLFDASNAYLASAEYAPNKFGDIGDYMRKKEVKVQTQNRDIALQSADPNTPQIFAGQSFWINGNTTPPMEELRKMILQRGGEVRPKLWNKGYVKYIIAPSLTLRKFDEFKNYKVVKEGWIVESCKEGKMLDWTRWKLQIAGGWEENGRKGLEGFLRGEPSQRRPEVVEDTEEEEEEEVEEPLEDGNPRQGDFPPTTSIPTATPVARGSLIAPNQTQPKASTNIPLSRQDPAVRWREMLPIKDDKPEGPWENYYTKSSNDHAAEALRNSEWRIKNTAERGNEGGFIDGYYQNSRCVLQDQEEGTGC